MIYQLGDKVKTTEGIRFCQCSLVMQGDFEGRVLHWFHNESGQDILYWDHELEQIKVK